MDLISNRQAADVSSERATDGLPAQDHTTTQGRM